jgi:pectate lyase
MKYTNAMLTLAATITLTACGGGGGGSGGNKSSAVVISSSLALSSSSSVSSAVLSSSSVSSVDFDFTSCDNFNTAQGFAAEGNGVSGGADVGLGNNIVTVTNGVQLNNVLNKTHATYGDKPLTVYIDGTITWENSGNAEIRLRRSNVSIIGLENSGEFHGVGIRISHGASNIIIRNLLMHEVPQSRGAGDHIHLDGQDGAVSNVWIDHNEFYNDLTVDKDFYDELVSGRSDVKNVTISYNILRDSQKTSLWGSSDDAVAEDVGRTISFHHNYWKGVVSRLPLFRFGEGHLWNNYYSGVTGSAINSRMGAKLRIDNNVFENVKNPILSVDSPSIGYWNATGNSFTGVSWGSTPTASCTTPPCYAGTNDVATTDYEPPYTYNAIETAQVKEHVLAYAGRNKIANCLDLPESSGSSSSSSAANSALLVSEDFGAADVATFFSAAYKAMPGNNSQALYRAISGSSRISFNTGQISFNNARFSIGDLSEGMETSSTTQPNGAFDLSQPYRISFTITAATGTGNFQVYVDNNTSTSEKSIHTTDTSTTVSRLLQMKPTDITSFPHEVIINSSVGTANSFFQIRADSSVSNLTIDNLVIEYQ